MNRETLGSALSGALVAVLLAFAPAAAEPYASDEPVFAVEDLPLLLTHPDTAPRAVTESLPSVLALADSALAIVVAEPFRPMVGATLPLPQVAFKASTAGTGSYGSMFLRGWVPLTGLELTLLAITASLPKDWTGWSAHFVRDGVNHLERAYTKPPVWDEDGWFHNYVGHPYGGNVYYNTVRCQGATPVQSMFFCTVLSVQWEYVIEAVAERPSIQDLVITPVVGSALGELSHRLTVQLKKGGTNALEKLTIVLLNPTHAIFKGIN